MGQGSDRMSLVYLAKFQAFFHKTLFGTHYQLTDNQVVMQLKFKLNFLAIFLPFCGITAHNQDLFS